MWSERRNYLLFGRQWTRREVVGLLGATLFLAACGQQQPPPPKPTATPGRIGPVPETPSTSTRQFTSDQFLAQEQQLYKSGSTVDILLQDPTFLLNPEIGNGALEAYSNAQLQELSVNDVFRITLQSPQQGEVPIRGLIPKDSPAGKILYPPPDHLPTIVALEGQVVNVKILTFSDTEIYSNQGLALLCTKLTTG